MITLAARQSAVSASTFNSMHEGCPVLRHIRDCRVGIPKLSNVNHTNLKDVQYVLQLQ